MGGEHALVPVCSADAQLMRVEVARRALAEAKTYVEVKDIRDQAQAVQHYLQVRSGSFEAQQDAAEIKLRAERKLGQMLEGNTGHGGDRRSSSHRESLKRLPDDVTHNDSHRWRRVAKLQDKKFEDYVSETRERKQELTTAGALRLAKEEAKVEGVADSSNLETCTVDDLQKLVAAGRKFGTIYADPPWDYSNTSTRAHVGEKKSGKHKGKVRHYLTLSTEDIANLPVAELTADQCHLHLWTTEAFLEEGIGLLKHWGFERKSGFVWVKPELGIGNYWRCSHEIMLLGVKGGLTFPATNIKSWIHHERTEHSAKPPEVRKLIEKVSPGPRLELFGRCCIDNWVVWGNQISRGMFDSDVEVL